MDKVVNIYIVCRHEQINGVWVQSVVRVYKSYNKSCDYAAKRNELATGTEVHYSVLIEELED